MADDAAVLGWPDQVTAMTAARRSVVAIGVSAAALALAGAGSTAVSPSYEVNGVEVAATSTEGTFVGSGTGSSGDSLFWTAVVDHTPLSPSATVTGGSLTALSYGDGSLSALTGRFTGGTVTYDTARSSPAPCGNQVFDVVGRLALTSGSAAGTGAFQVYLTHYRLSVLGTCVTYAASVRGAPGLTTSF
ncbi:MAG TPA: hypothetical protein VFA88_04950 [Gaiellaceae bacterium]|nr:hypothetical protein [Gaiellaceae bacterium]